MRTTIRFFSVLAAVGLAFAFSKATPVQAADFCVNPDGAFGCYDSIQEAIDEVPTDSTILIWNGSYEENLVIDRPLTLVGDVSAEIWADGDADIIQIIASGVTISGVTISSDQSTSGEFAAVRISGVNQAYLIDNTIYATDMGICIEDSSGVDIDNNHISGGNISIKVDATVSYIHGNTISSSSTAGIYGAEGSANNTISQNDISGHDGDGIYLENASLYSIANNEIGSNHANGIELVGSHHITITHNVIKDNVNDGILIRQPDEDNLSSPNYIYSNDFNNEVYNLEVEAGIDVIDAERNWWAIDAEFGENGFSEKLLGNIDYSPWCINEFCTSMAIRNLNLDTFYSSIQAAVFEAEDGNSIAIEAGIYVENVFITKPIEIGGSGEGDTFILTQDPGPVCTEPSSDRICPGAFSIFLVESDGVYIHDLTVDGDNPDINNGYTIGGANIDTRNGIIANYPIGQYDIRVERVTAKNFYMTGIYSNGTGSVFTDVTVQNVQGDATLALGIGGNVAEISDNTITHTTIAIGLESDENVLVDHNTISDAKAGILSLNSCGGASCGAGEQITNNIISACRASGFGIVISSNHGAVNVANNQVSGCIMGLSVAGSSATSTPVNFTNNTVTAPANPSGSFGVYLTTNKQLIPGTGSIAADFTSNTISGFANGVYLYDPNHLTIDTDFYHNRLTDNTAQVVNGTSGTLISDFEENWWGSAAGPATGSVSAGLDFTPWCGNSACSSLVPSAGVIEIPTGTAGSVVQQYLNNAPQNTEIRFLGSPGSLAGGFIINTPHLTILLRNGTVIQNNSPCFVVNANYTTIKTESVGGAICIPTNGSNGIDVTAPRVNTVIQGIEFPGTAGADGIHFAGAITDTVLVNNWFHNLVGDGIDFAVQPAGTVNIQGNLFQSNGGMGINSPGSVAAQFNSWGHVNGADYGDGASSGVVTDPYTHVDLYMVSSGTPSINQVMPGDPITHTVYAHVVNTLAVDFWLYYPAELTLSGSPQISGTFESFAQIDTSISGRIHFYGMAAWDDEYGSSGGYPPVTGDVPIFSATFTAGSPTAAATLNLNELTDKFAMESYQSSTNIYASALADGTVNILTPLTATGTISMQGRTARDVIPAQITGTVNPWWGPYEAVSGEELSGNLVFSGVAGGTYTFTTSQPRCLNLTLLQAKNLVISADRSIAALELKCGNATYAANGDNQINIQDAAVIGAAYGTGDINSEGDVNYDNAVNILDMAILGGNFYLTAGTAYSAWTP